MPPLTGSLNCAALLFNLDGVLVDSTATIERTWRQWAQGQGLDGEAILRIAHGRRAIETVRSAAPHVYEAQAAAEVAALAAHEARETAGLRQVPGTSALVQQLPPDRWAVVTSGVRAVAEHRLRHVRLPLPSVMVCADEIVHGKPHPEGYLTAAAQLGAPPAACLVIEDPPAGLAAAHAAGMRALAIASTHAPDALADADLIAPTLSAVTVRVDRSGAATMLRIAVSGAPEHPGTDDG